MEYVDDDARRELLDLMLEVSFRREKVTLASGKESDFYLDLRQTLMRPRGVALAGALVLDRLLAGPPVDAVGGMAVGAVPLVSAVLAAAAARDPATPLLGFFVRKEAKKHGLGRRIEGGFAAGPERGARRGHRDDRRLDARGPRRRRGRGRQGVRVLCLVDRGEGAAEAFAGRGLELEALFTRADLPV